MRALIQKLSNNKDILGAFYFKGDNNLFSFTDQYSVPDSRIKRIALVLSQTMDALGGGVFRRFFLEGEDKRVSIFQHSGGYCGIVFSNIVPFRNIENIFVEAVSEAKEIAVEKEVPAKEKPKLKLAEKPKKISKEKLAVKIAPKEDIILNPSIFAKIREILIEYLGDFSDTIFENQMSDMKLDEKSASLSGVQKLCFSLQKASAMLIGPSSAREMVDKLLTTIKSEK